MVYTSKHKFILKVSEKITGIIFNIKKRYNIAIIITLVYVTVMGCLGLGTIAAEYITPYELQVMFTQKDLKLIYQAAEKVVLVKKVSNGGYKVVWITFSPFEHNVVRWANNYFLYASPTKPVEGIKLLGFSITQAQAQNRFIFNSDRTFSAPQYDPILQPNQYMILNDVPYNRAESLTFGMAQACQVNGSERPTQPLNAVLVPAKQLVKLIPEDKVLIFLAGNLVDGTIHNQVILESDLSKIALKQLVSGSAESVATELNFNDTKKITVKYYPDLGKFIQQ